MWDLDNTLWPGVAVEGSPDTLPSPDPKIIDIIAELERRGIVCSVASRNDPSMRALLLSHPMLAGRLVWPQVGWEPKSQAVRRIAEKLNVGLDALAFVDDSPYERAEVGYALSEVLVLAPEEFHAAMEWPDFQPQHLTDEARQRADMYRAEEKRRAAEEGFGGSRADFLRWCDMRLLIAPATVDDLPRIAELSERTHQLNSTGRRYTADELCERIEEIRWLVPTARLVDRFGDYGLTGVALVDRQPPGPPGPGVWLAELVMLSCRVEGRGIPAALLRWIMGEAKEAGVGALRAVYRVNERNLPMRLLFRQTGFDVIGKAQEDTVLVSRSLSEPLPDYPEWLHVNTAAEASQ